MHDYVTQFFWPLLYTSDSMQKLLEVVTVKLCWLYVPYPFLKHPNPPLPPQLIVVHSLHCTLLWVYRRIRLSGALRCVAHPTFNVSGAWSLLDEICADPRQWPTKVEHEMIKYNNKTITVLYDKVARWKQIKSGFFYFSLLPIHLLLDSFSSSLQIENP